MRFYDNNPDFDMSQIFNKEKEDITYCESELIKELGTKMNGETDSAKKKELKLQIENRCDIASLGLKNYKAASYSYADHIPRPAYTGEYRNKHQKNGSKSAEMCTDIDRLEGRCLPIRYYKPDKINKKLDLVPIKLGDVFYKNSVEGEGVDDLNSYLSAISAGTGSKYAMSGIINLMSESASEALKSQGYAGIEWYNEKDEAQYFPNDINVITQNFETAIINPIKNLIQGGGYCAGSNCPPLGSNYAISSGSTTDTIPKEGDSVFYNSEDIKDSYDGVVEIKSTIPREWMITRTNKKFINKKSISTSKSNIFKNITTHPLGFIGKYDGDQGFVTYNQQKYEFTPFIEPPPTINGYTYKFDSSHTGTATDKIIKSQPDEAIYTCGTSKSFTLEYDDVHGVKCWHIILEDAVSGDDYIYFYISKLNTKSKKYIYSNSNVIKTLEKPVVRAAAGGGGVATGAAKTTPPVTTPPVTTPPVTTPPATTPPVTTPPVTTPPVTTPPVTTPASQQFDHDIAPPPPPPPVQGEARSSSSRLTEPPGAPPDHPDHPAPVGEVGVTEPPPVTKPPVTKPPVTKPPVTKPPVTKPPVTKPPVTTSPATTSPATTSPATTSPATTSAVTAAGAASAAAATASSTITAGWYRVSPPDIWTKTGLVNNSKYISLNADGQKIKGVKWTGAAPAPVWSSVHIITNKYSCSNNIKASINKISCGAVKDYIIKGYPDRSGSAAAGWALPNPSAIAGKGICEPAQKNSFFEFLAKPIGKLNPTNSLSKQLAYGVCGPEYADGLPLPPNIQEHIKTSINVSCGGKSITQISYEIFTTTFIPRKDIDFLLKIGDKIKYTSGDISGSFKKGYTVRKIDNSNYWISGKQIINPKYKYYNKCIYEQKSGIYKLITTPAATCPPTIGTSTKAYPVQKVSIKNLKTMPKQKYIYVNNIPGNEGKPGYVNSTKERNTTEDNQKIVRYGATNWSNRKTELGKLDIADLIKRAIELNIEKKNIKKKKIDIIIQIIAIEKESELLEEAETPSMIRGLIPGLIEDVFQTISFPLYQLGVDPRTLLPGVKQKWVKNNLTIGDYNQLNPSMEIIFIQYCLEKEWLLNKIIYDDSDGHYKTLALQWLNPNRYSNNNNFSTAAAAAAAASSLNIILYGSSTAPKTTAQFEKYVKDCRKISGVSDYPISAAARLYYYKEVTKTKNIKGISTNYIDTKDLEYVPGARSDIESYILINYGINLSEKLKNTDKKFPSSNEAQLSRFIYPYDSTFKLKGSKYPQVEHLKQFKKDYISSFKIMGYTKEFVNVEPFNSGFNIQDKIIFILCFLLIILISLYIK